MHLCLEEKVVNAVHKDVDRRTGPTAKGGPLPEAVLRVQTKVNHNDTGHAHDNGQNRVDSEQKAVHMVEGLSAMTAYQRLVFSAPCRRAAAVVG